MDDTTSRESHWPVVGGSILLSALAAFVCAPILIPNAAPLFATLEIDLPPLAVLGCDLRSLSRSPIGLVAAPVAAVAAFVVLRSRSDRLGKLSFAVGLVALGMIAISATSTRSAFGRLQTKLFDAPDSPGVRAPVSPR